MKVAGRTRTESAFPSGRPWMDRLLEWICLCASCVCLTVLLALLASVAWSGWRWLDWQFLTSYASRFPAQAGIRAAWTGSLWLTLLTALVSIPLGIGAAIYLEEYLRDSRWKRLIQLNISNLAGVPSIVYGLLGLGIFVRVMRLNQSVLAGALTLSLVVLPIIIIAAQESLRAVTGTIRMSAFALGATRWQTVYYQVLPAALPGIMTGVILAVGRALGEAAPLLLVGAVGYLAFTPAGVMDRFTALPIQVFSWAARPQPEFQQLAAAASLVLLAILSVLNLIAAVIRIRASRGPGA